MVWLDSVSCYLGCARVLARKGRRVAKVIASWATLSSVCFCSQLR